MDGSQTTRVAAAPIALPWVRACGAARRREQLRLWRDPVTRAAAARVLMPHDPGTDAFAALYVRYAPYVAAISIRMLGRDDELDVLVQDVLMQALRGLSEVAALPEATAFKRAVTHIAVRCATRRLRKRLPSCVSAPHSQRMRSREVYDQLDLLPAPSRAMWVLRHVQGEPLHAIAQRTRCSLTAVQQHLTDAQTTLEDGFVRDYAI